MKKLHSIFLLTLLCPAMLSAQTVLIGNAGNALSSIRTQQTQVYTNQQTNSIVFIHRRNPDISEPQNGGHLMYDISTDGGNTWTTNIGPINPVYPRPARHPSVAIYNPAGNTDPAGSFILWQAPTLSGGNNFDGWLSGSTPFGTTAPAPVENYIFQSSNSGIPGGLSERVNGEFWSVEIALVGDTASDTIWVMKGTWNTTSNEVDWSINDTLIINFSLGFDGSIHSSAPVISFSPDGQTGYIGLVGDIGTADSIYNVVYCKSTDGGQSWGSWNEVNPNSVSGLLDTAQQVLVNTSQGLTLIASGVTTSYDFDMTVDINGNPHFFSTILTSEVTDFNEDTVISPKQYTVYASLPKSMWDLYSTNGGTNWTGNFVGSVGAFQRVIPSADNIETYNYPQIARSQDGSIVFYSWTDTDTLAQGPVTENSLPNIRTAGLRVTDGFKTCFKRLEIAGVNPDDNMYTPTMAPVVLEGINGSDYTLPIVTMAITSNGDNPVSFYYVGRYTVFCDAEFVNPASLDLSVFFGGCYMINPCTLGAEETDQFNFRIYPNPASDVVNISHEPNEEITRLSVFDMLGNEIYTQKNFTQTIPAHLLPNGVYLLQMQTLHRISVRKFVVQH